MITVVVLVLAGVLILVVAWVLALMAGMMDDHKRWADSPEGKAAREEAERQVEWRRKVGKG